MERAELWRARRQSDSRPVLLKCLEAGADPKESEWLAKEYEILGRLDAAGIPRPLALFLDADPPLAVWEGFSGTTLETAIEERVSDLPACLRIAIRLAEAVSGIHAGGFIHGDLRPTHILIDSGKSAVQIIDFRRAFSGDSPAPPMAPPEGDLDSASFWSHISPERTGRTNRPADYRTDFYSLGIILYRLFTGDLPFHASDPLEWVHCHLARQPRSPMEASPGIPEAVSEIILKLLAKDPEARYQSARGLLFDLGKALSLFEATGRIQPFAPGERDMAERLRIPNRLYGREPELARIREFYSGAVSSGRPGLLLFSGAPGSGKTSLAIRLRAEAEKAGGYFLTGKFERNKQDIPYGIIGQAFHGWVKRVLAEGEADVARWKKQLVESLGNQAGILAGIIPQLALILGAETPRPPDMLSLESQRRFHLAFSKFVGAVAKPEHPLALFLDDLQWADAASLALITHLLMQPDTRHLIVIGAYRETELQAGHPLMGMLDTVSKAASSGGAKITGITVGPIGEEAIGLLLANTLRGAAGRLEELARLVHRKTEGNPFFVRQFLETLFQEGLLIFDPEGPGWRWDDRRILAAQVTDNVGELLASRIAKLHSTAQTALEWAACLGHRFDVDTLALVSGKSRESIARDLFRAARLSLILPDLGDATGVPGGEGGAAPQPSAGYRWVHDRIQHAAYSMIRPGEAPRLHLSIARALIRSSSPEEMEARLFEIVNHCNNGLDAITDPGGKTEVAELELAAGRKAKLTNAFAAAARFLAVGMGLLEPEPWEKNYDLAFSLQLLRAECELYAHNLPEAKRLAETAVLMGRSNLEKIEALRIKQLIHIAAGEQFELAAAGLEGLSLMGIDLPREPSWQDVLAERERVDRLLEKRPIEALVDLPRMTDPVMQALLRLGPFSYHPNRNLFALHTLRLASLCLEHGTSDAAAVWYGMLAVLLSGQFGEYRQAHRLARTALEIAKMEKSESSLARSHLLLGLIAFWVEGPESMDAELRTSEHFATESGDMLVAEVCKHYALICRYYEGEPLQDTLREARSLQQEVTRPDYVEMLPIFINFLGSLGEKAKALPSFEDAGYNPEEYESGESTRTNFTKSWYWLWKLEACFLAGEISQALEAGKRLQPIVWSIANSPPYRDYLVYHSLTLAAWMDGKGERATSEEKASWRTTLDGHVQRLGRLAEVNPRMFGPAHALVSAEQARLGGREWEASLLYRKAMHEARENRLFQDEALALEASARFYQAAGFPEFADANLRDAHRAYARWGAEAKVKQIEDRNPHLMLRAPSVAPPRSEEEHLDYQAAVKASQAISGEIVLDRVMDALMRTVLESAGAQKSCLLMASPEGLLPAAEARVEGQVLEVRLLGKSGEAPGPELPATLLNFVRRTREKVLLSDASEPNPFSADPYFSRFPTKSVLAMPILRQSEMVGVLYLENALVAGAFTSDRLATLELIAAQAAISLQNARLFADLEAERARLKAVIEQSPAGIVIAEAPTGRLIVINDQVGQLFRQRVEGQPEIESYNEYGAGFHANGRRYEPTEWPLSRSILTGETVDGEEIEIVRGDGTRAWLSLSSAPIRNAEGKIAAGVAIMLDITRRKRAEERFSKAFHDSPTPSGIIRMRDEVWIDVNEGLLGLLGYSREEIIGRRSGEIGMPDPDQRAEMWKSLFEKGSVRDLEQRLQAKSGESRVVLASLGIIELDGDKCLLGSFLDMTGRKQVEEQLRQSQKMEAIGNLAGGIAHDFNNLLTAINGYASLALQGLDESVPRYQFLREILMAGERASDLTRQLLTYSRKQVVETKIWNLNEIVSGVQTMLKRLIGEDIELVANLGHDVGPIKADRGQIEQILLNLAVNARDAMPQGGRLSIETVHIVLDQPYLDTQLETAAGPHVLLSVSDTGSGMTPEVQARLFEPFFTTKEVGKGTGLGLAVVYGIVKQGGGSISVYSEVGKGTTFQIYFPEIHDAGEPFRERLPMESQEFDRGDETILLVEDEESVRKFARYALEERGYRILEAGNGKEALKVLEESALPIDLLITDVVMPEMGGLELAARIAKSMPTLPILYISGFTDTAAAHGGVLEEGEKFLQKPFSPSQLTKKAREMLGRAGKTKSGTTAS